MRCLLPLAALVLFSSHLSAEVTYTLTPDFITPPPGKTSIGDGHGEIRVDKAGLIYISVQGQPEGGIQVYSPEGKYLRHLAGTPGSLHGFVIHQEETGEFIYAAVLGDSRVLKMTLDGKVVLEIPKTAFPAEQSAPGLKLTSCDVAPNGDIYVVGNTSVPVDGNVHIGLWDVFVARFGSLQDTLADKLLPELLGWLGESMGPAIDNVARAERLGWISDGQA